MLEVFCSLVTLLRLFLWHIGLAAAHIWVVHLPGKVAGILAEYGNDKPNTSRAVPIVFALTEEFRSQILPKIRSTYVNMPPQAPDPGQAWRTTSNRSSSEIFPVAYAPRYDD